MTEASNIGRSDRAGWLWVTPEQWELLTQPVPDNMEVVGAFEVAADAPYENGALVLVAVPGSSWLIVARVTVEHVDGKHRIEVRPQSEPLQL